MSCNKCSKTVSVANCTTGCKSTLNSDCIIYDDIPLDFESDSIEDGDKRTLTSLLQQIISCCTKESKIINFNADGETDDALSYTLLEEDTRKVLLLKQTDAGENIDYTIVLPQTTDFIDKEIVIKDISESSNEITWTFSFNISVQYSWTPVTTTTNLATLWDSIHKTLKLRFVKTTPTSYQWIVCP